MANGKLLIYGFTPALAHGANLLSKKGWMLTREPGSEVTALLLPVPSFGPQGNVTGADDLQPIVQKLPQNSLIIGGNLSNPVLRDRTVADLLQDPVYLAQNAYITAHCAVRLALNRLPVALRGCPALVIGWGRIGKCLAAMLRGLEANVTVAARKEADRAMALALGYGVTAVAALNAAPYRVIFNTVPAPVLAAPPAEALCIDLASSRGLGGAQTLWARGLPGRDAPEASGELLASTVERILKEAKL